MGDEIKSAAEETVGIETTSANQFIVASHARSHAKPVVPLGSPKNRLSFAPRRRTIRARLTRSIYTRARIVRMQIRVWSKVARWSPLVANSLLTKRFRARPPSPPPPPHPRSPARRLCYAYGLVVNNTNVIVARIFPKPLKLVRTNSPHVLRTESVRVFITVFFFSIFNRVKNYVRVRFVTAVCTAHASRWTVR